MSHIGIKYAAISTAIADFIYAFPNGFTDEKKSEYLKNTIDRIQKDKEEQNLSSDDLKYYEYYEEIIDLLWVANKVDYLRLINFLSRNQRKEDRKLERKDDSKKIQTENIHRIASLLNDAYAHSHGVVFVQIGPDYEKRSEEERNRNRAIYALLLMAIKSGLDNSTSISKEEFDYAKFKDYESDLTPEEIDNYYRKTYNTVTSLTKKYKGKLKSVIKNKL